MLIVPKTYTIHSSIKSKESDTSAPPTRIFRFQNLKLLSKNRITFKRKRKPTSLFLPFMQTFVS